MVRRRTTMRSSRPSITMTTTMMGTMITRIMGMRTTLCSPRWVPPHDLDHASTPGGLEPWAQSSLEPHSLPMPMRIRIVRSAQNPADTRRHCSSPTLPRSPFFTLCSSASQPSSLRTLTLTPTTTTRRRNAERRSSARSRDTSSSITVSPRRTPPGSSPRTRRSPPR
jgi:hypothetical protein